MSGQPFRTATCATCGVEATWDEAHARHWWMLHRAGDTTYFACSASCAGLVIMAAASRKAA